MEPQQVTLDNLINKTLQRTVAVRLLEMRFAYKRASKVSVHRLEYHIMSLQNLANMLSLLESFTYLPLRAGNL